MDKIRLVHDIVGSTLTMWLGDPSTEHICEETADEVVLMKDAAGRLIGVEILHYRPATVGAVLNVETFVTPAA